MKIRFIGFALLTALNGYVTYHIWDVLCISTLSLCFLALSYLCGVLFLINIKDKTQRIITYIVNVIILILGIAYAIYFRRPLGFYTAFSSAILFAKNFIAGPARKDKYVTKKLNIAQLLITVTILTVTITTFSSAIIDPLANGAGILWTVEDENHFDEICNGTTDEEKVKAAYNWMVDNITYDHNYNCLYQHSDINKILQTKTGICYDISCLFAAICRSHNIPCYVIDGYSRADCSVRHTWNRVLIDGIWYHVDITNDITAMNTYGFHSIPTYDFVDENFVITRIY